MTVKIIHGKVVRLRLPRKPKYEREPINAPYCRELWAPGPVAKVARMLAKEDYRKELVRKGQDLRGFTEGWIDKQVTILLYNSGEHYLNRAKEWLR